MRIQRRTLLIGFLLAACKPITRLPESSPQTTGGVDGQAALAPCEPTRYYTTFAQPSEFPKLPMRITLPRPDEPGERLIVSGVVYAEDCVTPLEGALLDVWQANAQGEYTYLQGQLMTDAQGRYQIDTIRPSMYGPPPHIHFRIAHPNAQPIETELLFAGDPGVDEAPDEVAITTLTQDTSVADSPLRATFDIVLQTATIAN